MEKIVYPKQNNPKIEVRICSYQLDVWIFYFWKCK